MRRAPNSVDSEVIITLRRVRSDRKHFSLENTALVHLYNKSRSSTMKAVSQEQMNYVIMHVINIIYISYVYLIQGMIIMHYIT